MKNMNITYNPIPFDATTVGTDVGFTSSGTAPRKGWRTPLDKNRYSEQRDAETSLSYFGARYYDADLLTGWLSIDPMSDKYPSLSPYNYCAENPVKLVDPDGRDVWEVDKAGNVSHINDKGGYKMQFVTYSTGKKITYTGNFYHDILSNISHASYYTGCGLAGSSMAELFLDMANNSDSEWEMARYNNGNYYLGTIHDSDHSPSIKDDFASIIHSHPNAKNAIVDEKKSMGLVCDANGTPTKETIKPSDISIVGTDLQHKGYFIYMKQSGRIWQLESEIPMKVGIKNHGVGHNPQKILSLLNKY